MLSSNWAALRTILHQGISTLVHVCRWTSELEIDSKGRLAQVVNLVCVSIGFFLPGYAVVFVLRCDPSSIAFMPSHFF